MIDFERHLLIIESNGFETYFEESYIFPKRIIIGEPMKVGGIVSWWCRENKLYYQSAHAFPVCLQEHREPKGISQSLCGNQDTLHL